MRIVFIAAAALPLLTGGCLSTVGSIVTAPVKVAGQGGRLVHDQPVGGRPQLRQEDA